MVFPNFDDEKKEVNPNGQPDGQPHGQPNGQPHGQPNGQPDGQPNGQQCGVKRKEAKENKNNSININNTLMPEKGDVLKPPALLFAGNTARGGGLKQVFSAFRAPSVDEVRAFIEQNGFKVDAETFVNFYESRGWKIGSTAISNWQATVRLWHQRAEQKGKENGAFRKEEESYWSEMSDRCPDALFKGSVLRGEKSLSSRQNLPVEKEVVLDLKQQPFERFMNRVEKYDISGDKNE